MSDFRLHRDRDAYPVIRGYRYQVDQTILRWLALDGACALELERGEDIDRVSLAFTTGGEETARILEQVKHLADPITLKSPQSIEALVNALEHREANPTLPLLFRFCTNAASAIERPSPFRPRRPGIEAWRAVRDRQSEPDPSFVGGIRAVLRQAKRPDGCTDANWLRFDRFVAHASAQDLVGLIDAFEWGTGEPGAEDLEPRIVLRLLTDGHAAIERDARRQYQLLFVTVVKRLSQPGLKRVTRAELLDQLRVEYLAEADAALLRRLEEHVLGLDRRLTVVEDAVRRHGDQITDLLAVGRNIGTVAMRELGPVEVELPANVATIALRTVTTRHLIDVLQRTKWLALHGGVGTGKTELSKLVARAGDFRPVLFLSLRDRSSAEAELQLLRSLRAAAALPEGADRAAIIRGAVARLSSNGLFVLDDLPPLVAGDGLSRALVDLCRACRGCDAHVLTTSHHTPPETIVEQLPEPDRTVLPIPPFTDAEAGELFSSWGMPNDGIDADTLYAVNAAAERHPMLLAAAARYLSKRGWRVDRSTLLPIVRGEHAAGTVDESLRRLTTTVEDITDRRYLYRLCLIQGAFRRQQALLVAGVYDLLDRPRERLSRLSGLWVQPDRIEQMLVSPLVRPLAATELPAAERRAVQIALAEEIGARRPRSVLDVATAVTYLTAADEYDSACVLLIVAFQSSRPLPRDQLRLLLAASWQDRPLPPQMQLAHRLYLRAFQIKAADRVGLPTQQMFVESDGLVAGATADDLWAVFGFTVQTLPIRARNDFVAAMRDLRRAAELLPHLTAPGGPLENRPPEMGAASLLWFVVTEVRSAVHLHLWLDAAESVDAEELRHVFATGRSAYHGCQLAVDNVWMAEHEQPAETRDWATIEAVLRRAQEIGARLEIEPLFAAAVRARIVVLADYLKSLNAAQSIASSALATARQPASVLLIAESIGRQFLFQKRYPDAIVWLRRAVEVDAENFTQLRMEARIYLATAIAEGEGHTEDALRLVEEGAAIVRGTSDPVVPIQRVAAAGELAIARWCAGDGVGSFRAFDDAVSDLFAAREDSVAWKSMFVLLGHAGGYLSGAVRDLAPTHVHGGDAYTPPYRLMFLTAYRADRAALYNDTRAAFLPSLMAMFAEAVGDDDRAAYWAELGIADGRARGLPAVVSSLGWQLVAQLARRRQFVEAIDAAREAALAGVAGAVLNERGETVFNAGIDPAAVLAGASSESRKDVDAKAVAFGTLPVAFAIASLALDDPDAASASTREVVALCRSAAAEAADATPWNLTAEVLEATFVHRVSCQQLNQMANESARAEQHSSHIIGYLGMSLAPDASLETAAVAQVLIMPRIEKVLSTTSSLYRQTVPAFITRFWRGVVATQGFRFISPAMVKSDIEAALTRPPDEQVRAILRLVIGALNARLPENAEHARAWLAS